MKQASFAQYHGFARKPLKTTKAEYLKRMVETIIMQITRTGRACENGSQSRSIFRFFWIVIINVMSFGELRCDPQTKGCTFGIRFLFAILVHKVSSATAVASPQQLANRVALRAVALET